MIFTVHRTFHICCGSHPAEDYRIRITGRTSQCQYQISLIHRRCASQFTHCNHISCLFAEIISGNLDHCKSGSLILFEKMPVYRIAITEGHKNPVHRIHHPVFCQHVVFFSRICHQKAGGLLFVFKGIIHPVHIVGKSLYHNYRTFRLTGCL